MLQVQNLSKSYGTQKVLDKVSLTLAKGQSLALLGPSGCGKSTLLKTIAGLVAPSAGTITFLDQDITRVPPHRRKIPLVFQDHLLFPHLTIADNIAFGLKTTKLAPKEIQQRIAENLDLIQLAGLGHRYPSQISGGQRQRVALARAMVLRPRLILLDEPLSHLDTSLRIDMRRLISFYCRTYGTAMILVTHDPEEALSLGDFLAVMTEGRLWELAPAEQMYRTPKTLVSAKMMGFENRLPASTADSSTVLLLRPEDLQVRAPSDPATPGAVLGTLTILEFEGDQGRAAFATAYGPLAWRGSTKSPLYQALREAFRDQTTNVANKAVTGQWQLSWDPEKAHRLLIDIF